MTSKGYIFRCPIHSPFMAFNECIPLRFPGPLFASKFHVQYFRFSETQNVLMGLVWWIEELYKIWMERRDRKKEIGKKTHLTFFDVQSVNLQVSSSLISLNVVIPLCFPGPLLAFKFHVQYFRISETQNVLMRLVWWIEELYKIGMERRDRKKRDKFKKHLSFSNGWRPRGISSGVHSIVL